MSYKSHASSSEDSPAKGPEKAASKSANSTEILKPTEQYVYLAIEEERYAYEPTTEHFFELFASKEDANRRLEVRRTVRRTEPDAMCMHYNDEDWDIEYDEYGCFHAVVADQGDVYRFLVWRIKVHPEGSVPTIAVARELEDEELEERKRHRAEIARVRSIGTGEKVSD